MNKKVKITKAAMVEKPDKKVTKTATVERREKKVVEEGAMVAKRAVGGSQLGAIVSKAMQEAIQKCYDEGQLAPQVIKERMMAAREGAISAYNAMHEGGGG